MTNMSKKIETTKSYLDHRPKDPSLEGLITQAKRLYVVGKHAGSKPTNRLKKRIIAVNRNVAKYATAFKAMLQAKEAAEAKKAEDKNVDIPEAQIVEDNPTT